MEKVSEIVTAAVQGIAHPFGYDINEERNAAPSGEEQRTAGEIIEQRGGEITEHGREMADSAKSGTLELRDRGLDQSQNYYEHSKDKAANLYEEGKDKAANLYEEGKDKASEYYDQSKDKTSSFFEEGKNKAGEIVEAGKEKVGQAIDTVKSTTSDYYNAANEKVGQAVDTVKETWNSDTRAPVQDIRFAAYDLSNGIQEKVETGKESFKEYIGEKMESIKNTILDGNTQAHDIVTGQGLRSDDSSSQGMLDTASDKAHEFKESAKETMRDFSEGTLAASSDKMGDLSEKIEDKRESAKENVDSAADKLEAFCNDAELKLNDAAIAMT